MTLANELQGTACASSQALRLQMCPAAALAFHLGAEDPDSASQTFWPAFHQPSHLLSPNVV